MKNAPLSLGYRLALLPLFVAPFVAVACADAIHLDLPPGQGGSANVGGSGGGGTACRSNSDCAAPTPVCDTVKQTCFECLELADCAQKPGTVCSLGACDCPTAGESWCEPAVCTNLATSSEHCGACGHACFGSCAAGACLDPWEPTSADGAPAGRYRHVAVWTGDEMIVWGGVTAGGDTNTGGIYDPASRTWRATSTVDAPSARSLATAVWTGTEMVVWGGLHAGTALNTGARFDPDTNTWSPVSLTGAPVRRYLHTAVWTDTEMIVWGGNDGTTRLPTGARYDPSANTWNAMASPLVPRDHHTAVWTGTSMLTFGGIGIVAAVDGVVLPGAGEAGGWSYTPSGDSWTSLTTINEPSARYDHTAVFGGGGLVVWGGYDGTSALGTGANYSTVSSSWTASNPPEPAARYGHRAVWLETGSVMVMWGGSDTAGNALESGGVYNPTSNAWTATPTALSARFDHTMVSIGASVIVWGGRAGGQVLGDGGIYTP
ncbi:MAG: hypothetical protein HY908_01945 [Myxococcales bacterium]|nr:hypothetical protein [Myxococcales bacterium]